MIDDHIQPGLSLSAFIMTRRKDERARAKGRTFDPYPSMDR
jgi:hypothetical protein